jgi:hypothetical protein
MKRKIFYGTSLLLAATLSFSFNAKPYSGQNCTAKISSSICLNGVTDQCNVCCETYFSGAQCTLTTAHIAYPAFTTSVPQCTKPLYQN